MMEFKKATLEPIDPKPVANPPSAGPVMTVQINPATLRMQMASTVDFGKDANRQKTTYQGSTSTLSFDLVFDTADEGKTDEPKDVRVLTAQLERFVLPQMNQKKSVPPRVRFTYGTFSVIGVMTSLNQDFDLFAASGVPLRAKCAVSIKIQKPEFDAKLAGPGANTGAGATPPIPPGVGGGAARPPAPPSDRTGSALAGESAPDFANRMGLDPRAWKGLEGITDPLRLEAGLQIDFSASLSIDLGIGASATVGAGPSDRDLVTGGSTGAAGPTGAVPTQAPADGEALTASGGLTRALDRAASATADTAAAGTRSAFVSDAVERPTPPVGIGTPSPLPGAPPVPSGPSAAAATATADRRAVSFGFGVPLRPRLGATHAAAVGLVHERTPGIASGGELPPVTDDPTVAPWRALRELGAGGTAGRPGCSCGGSGPSRTPCGCAGANR